MDRPLVIAHRGASFDAPEHTAFAYAEAVRQGADSIELDLQLTADGVLVTLHDETLERVAGLPDEVAAVAYADLLEVDLGGWFNRAHPGRADGRFAGARVQTLTDVLVRHPPPLRLHLELKSPSRHGGRVEQALVDVLRDHGELEATHGDSRLVVECFEAESLRRVRTLAPAVPTGLLWYEARPDLLRAEVPDWVDVTCPESFVASMHPELVSAAHERGLEVHVWTVDDPEEIAALVGAGVDGIFTNRPSVAREVVDRAG